MGHAGRLAESSLRQRRDAEWDPCDERSRDGLDFARGVLLGLLVGILLWSVVLSAILLAVSAP